MSSEEILKVLTAISKQSNGLITTKEAGVNGVSRAMLSKLCNLGKISRISAGQYVFATELGDELFSLSKRSSLFIFSHETALFLNGISERTPFEHTVTIICGKNVRNLHHSFCTLSDVKTVVYIKEDDAQVILAYLSNSLDVICQDVVREEESTMIILNRFIESLK